MHVCTSQVGMIDSLFFSSPLSRQKASVECSRFNFEAFLYLIKKKRIRFKLINTTTFLSQCDG